MHPFAHFRQARQTRQKSGGGRLARAPLDIW